MVDENLSGTYKEQLPSILVHNKLFYAGFIRIIVVASSAMVRSVEGRNEESIFKNVKNS
jgi:hypothetical protein